MPPNRATKASEEYTNLQKKLVPVFPEMNPRVTGYGKMILICGARGHGLIRAQPRKSRCVATCSFMHEITFFSEVSYKVRGFGQRHSSDHAKNRQI